jgi:mono/diheme cytochrome c family protein
MKTFALMLLTVVILLSEFSAKTMAQNDLGRLEFQYGCAACHGPDGKGNGPLAVAEQLTRSPPDLTLLAKSNGGVFPVRAVYDIIDGRREIKAHGTRAMPVWGYRYTPSTIMSSSQAYLDPTYEPEAIVRNRILEVIDYLYRLQEY